MLKRMILFMAMVAVTASGQEVAYDLRPGDSRSVLLDEPIRALSSDQENVATVEAREGDRGLRINAHKAGSAVITVELRSGVRRAINVNVGDDIELVREHYMRLLKDVLGVNPPEITPTRDHILVSGEIRQSVDWKKFRAVMDVQPAAFKSRVIENVVFSPKVPTEALLAALRAVDGLLDPDVSTALMDGKAVVKITGRAFSEAGVQKADESIRRILEQAGLGDVGVVSTISMEPSDMEVEFVWFELSSTISDRIGVDLLNGIGLNLSIDGSRARGGDYMSLIQGSVRLDKVVEFLAQSGGGQIIARQTVSVQNGREATVNAGGQITLRPQVTDGGTSDAVTVPYGFMVRVQPKLLASRNVSLEIPAFEITEARAYESGVGDVQVEGTKGATVVTVAEGAQRLLTHYDRRYNISRNSGVPILRHIPLLKYFFSSVEKQLVLRKAGILVTVQARTGDQKPIFPPLADETEQAIELIRQRMESTKAQ